MALKRGRKMKSKKRATRIILLFFIMWVITCTMITISHEKQLLSLIYNSIMTNERNIKVAIENDANSQALSLADKDKWKERLPAFYGNTDIYYYKISNNKNISHEIFDGSFIIALRDSENKIFATNDLHNDYANRLIFNYQPNTFFEAGEMKEKRFELLGAGLSKVIYSNYDIIDESNGKTYSLLFLTTVNTYKEAIMESLPLYFFIAILYVLGIMILSRYSSLNNKIEQSEHRL
jgi:hypothetical protein